MFQVPGLKILGRVGTYFFSLFFFLEIYNFMHFERQICLSKIYTFMHFERQFCLSKCIKLYIIQENLKKILGFTSKFRLGRVSLNTGIILFGLSQKVQGCGNSRAYLSNLVPFHSGQGRFFYIYLSLGKYN